MRWLLIDYRSSLGVAGQEDLDAVAGALGVLGGVGARAQPGGQRRMPQSVRADHERGVGECGRQCQEAGLVPDPVVATTRGFTATTCLGNRQRIRSSG